MVDPPSSRPTPAAGREGNPRSHTRTRRAFLVLAGILAILIAGGSAASIQGIHAFDRALGRIDVGPKCSTANCLRHVHDDPKCFTKVCNYLVLGSDSRAGLSDSQQSEFGQDSGSSRSDTIMFVHLNIPDNHTTIVSLPRDLYVPIPGHGYDKINAAYSYGPDVLVQTIEQLTGMQINHYVSVDFAGFERLVDAIGGVPVCINKPMIDHLAGLYLPKAGCYNLTNQQALGFVRARHIEGDLIPDFSRIARQQIFFRAMLKKLESAGSILDVRTLLKAINHNVVIDQNLDVFALQDLLSRLADVGQNGVDFRVVPAVPFVQNGIDYVRALQPETTEIFDRIQSGEALFRLGKAEPLTGMSPADIRVQVFDRNSNGKAERVAEYLSKAGFNVLPILPSPANLIRSQIRWPPDGHQQRSTLVEYLGGVKVIRGHTFGPAGAVIVVVTRTFPRPGSRVSSSTDSNPG
jgi:LCP family protein required for cell wall assembly